MIGAIILGIVAGYLGRFLMPGKDPMGFIATTLLGIGGAVVGFPIFTELLAIGRTETFDLGGLIGAVVCAMLPRFAYRPHQEHPRPAASYPACGRPPLTPS